MLRIGRGARAMGAVVVSIAAALVFSQSASAASFGPSGGLGLIPDGVACPAYGPPLDVTFTVTGINTAPGDVSVSFLLNPAHTFVGDLDVTLIAPDGTTQQTIFSRTGAVPSNDAGDSSNAAGSYTFSDQATDQPDGGWWQAAAATDETTAVPSGTFRSTAPGGVGRPGPAPFTLITPAFANLATSNGTWTLRFRDVCSGDQGTVTSAVLNLGQRFEVANTDDAGPGSLRQAILDANASAGQDTIDLTGATGTINLDSELPSIDEGVSIVGPGASQLTVRRNTGSFRVFHVSDLVPVSISGLTIANGDAPSGGGVLNEGELTLDHVVLQDNHASVGGAILSGGTSANLTLRDSTVTHNSADDGGGIYDSSAVSRIERSTISDNTASTSRGGYVQTLAAGDSVITNSTITGNSASGGIGGDGISVPIAGAHVVVENSTIGPNGAVSSVTAHDASYVQLKSTILSRGNAGGTNCGAGSFVSTGYNVASDASCALNQATDQSSTDPLLGPLADNGGPTLTMAPASTSPAIDRGNLNSLTDDQRGQARPVDMAEIANASGGFGADAGAVELQVGEVADPTVSVTAGPTGTIGSNQPTFSFATQNAMRIECSLDHGTPSYAPCSGATTDVPAGALADGLWIFRVRATAATGAQAADSRSFTVDTTTPSVSVDSGPNGPTLDQTPRFSFSASEPTTFACRITQAGQSADFGPCSGPGQTHAPGSISDGKYTFEVRAADAAGNTATASRSFTLTAASCRQALQDVIDANGALETARAKLKKAKASGKKAKIRKAKKAVKRAKKAQASAKDAVDQLCATSGD
jgi:subtilisin-like proprotein convertase family protein